MNLDFVIIGGKRGHGKSITCANIAVNTYNSGRSVAYFTIEMASRITMQRISAIYFYSIKKADVYTSAFLVVS